ncbi:MAG TPA: adenylate/guanylate cyclase domain-containing protein [Anaerolineae bacterium]|nr:adenylate/guanylate cyclase domain-containing protein [Anaerolineae bacterium]
MSDTVSLIPKAQQVRLQRFLPAELKSRLEGRLTLRDLREMSEALDSLRHNLSTYLTRELHTPREPAAIPYSRWIEGTTLFADLTGFTPLTEHLRELGDEGAERLNTMLNDLFAAMLEPLTFARGELLEFAGDAILAYFPAQAGAEDALWATRAALRMMRALLRTGYSEGPYPLKMSIGLARGRFFAAEIGNTQRMEYVIVGGTIPQAMIAEGQAAPEEVCVAPGMTALLAETFRLRPAPNSHAIVIDDFGERLDAYELDILSSRRRRGQLLALEQDAAAILQAVEENVATVERLARFFPPYVLNLIVAHQRARQFTGEHRAVSIIFANLRGFETLLEALGPPAEPLLTDWLNQYFVAAQTIISEAGGFISNVVSYIKGFNLLCSFGTPLTDEEMPERAVAAALLLNRRLAELVESLKERVAGAVSDLSEKLPQGLSLTQHIGVTYGPIYTGSAGWQERREYVTLGDDVNLSARLMSVAGAGQILISQPIYERVYHTFDCETLPPMQIKGKAKPVPIYAVQRRALDSMAWLSEAAAAPLIGREADLTHLIAAINALQSGAHPAHGAAVTLVGETGVGKTRLIAEVVRYARRHAIPLLAGRCLAYAQTIPYTPWIEALWNWFGLERLPDDAARRAHICQTLEQHNLATLAEPFMTLLTPLLPKAAIPSLATSLPPASKLSGLYARLKLRLEAPPTGMVNLPDILAQRVNRPRAADANRLPAEDGDAPEARSLWRALQARVDPAQAIVRLATALTPTGPLVIIIEDLQWGDQASWTVLRALAEHTAERPLLLLTTMQPGEVATTWCAQAGCQCQLLGGLNAAEIARIAASHLQAPPAPGLVEWLIKRTQGNPLFIVQLLHALIHSGALVKDADTDELRLKDTQIELPPTVREIMLSRVDQLPEETRTVFKLAAVIGETVPFNLLTRVAGLSRPALMSHITVLTRHGLLTPPPPSFEYTFTHPLLREALYSSLAYTQRRAWHRAIGDCLAGNAPETSQPHLEMLAYHYAHSDKPALGARYNRLAGDRACEQQTWDAARAYYRQALAIEGADSALQDEQRRAAEALQALEDHLSSH